jgi:uncharacterized damage-inducible protein DinB
MAVKDLSDIPEFYHKYVRLVQEETVLEALKNQGANALRFLENIPDDKWTFRYAEDKWSIKEMVQHIIDTERIFTYRALCIARGEKKSLPGFDENNYAAHSAADRRKKEDLIEEFNIVRHSATALFQSFTDEQLMAKGTANNNPIGVNGIGFITVGHVMHHLAILKERYLNMP